MTNNALSALLFVTTLFLVAAFAALDYRRSSIKPWAGLRCVGYLLVGLVGGIIGPLMSGHLGGLESGTSAASPDGVVWASAIAIAEVFLGVFLLWLSGRGPKDAG